MALETIVAGHRVAILGARGFTGGAVLALLVSSGWPVFAFARGLPPRAETPGANPRWCPLDSPTPAAVAYWISTIPIWELAPYFPLIAASGARRILALSSTSRFSKAGSGDEEERGLAARLEAGERELRAWAETAGIEWVILRPTMIYGAGRDHNVSSLLRFIRRFGFLPVIGAARGLRQPIHVDDLARACVAALTSPAAAGRDYNLGGGEILSYGELCLRLFPALGRRPRLVRIPLWLFRLARPLRGLLPPRLRWLVAMLERMNLDLVFDQQAARTDLDFRPRGFALAADDLVDRSNRILP